MTLIRTASRPATIALALALTAGCGGDGGSTTTPPERIPQAPPMARGPVVRHDFGTIRHGDVARADIEIPLPDASAALIPVAFQRDCTCAKHVFVIVDPSGHERLTAGQAFSQFAVKDGEKLVLRLEIHSSEKEAVDQQKVAVRGQLVLQEDSEGHARHLVPVQFDFAIDAPLSIEPYAHLDLNDMPRSVRFEQTFTVRADQGSLELTDVRAMEMDPRHPRQLREVADCEVATARDSEGDGVLVTVAFRASDERMTGPFAFEVVGKTNLPGDYAFRLPVSGRVVESIQVSPPEQFSFGLLDFSKPSEQMVVVTDHDKSRTADFVVHSIVSGAGRDLSAHFSVEFTPMPDNTRARYVTLRYDGSLAEKKSFRGLLHLAKTADAESLVSIPFVGFHRLP